MENIIGNLSESNKTLSESVKELTQAVNKLISKNHVDETEYPVDISLSDKEICDAVSLRFVRFIEKLKLSGISYKQLCGELGMSEASIKRLRDGKVRPGLAQITRAAVIYGLDVELLFKPEK